MKRAYIVLGLGFGDEGKGSCVDAVCRREKVDLVVRFSGGSNCLHTVVEPSGRSHAFSQWGSGTLAGVPTYLGPHVIINPPAMVREAGHLKEVGVDGVWGLLSVNPDCLVTTRYHRLSNQISELLRGNDRHGSCGHGIGEDESLLAQAWPRRGDCSKLKREAILVRSCDYSKLD